MPRSLNFVCIFGGPGFWGPKKSGNDGLGLGSGVEVSIGFLVGFLLGFLWMFVNL